MDLSCCSAALGMTTLPIPLPAPAWLGPVRLGLGKPVTGEDGAELSCFPVRFPSDWAGLSTGHLLWFLHPEKGSGQRRPDLELV